MSRHRNSGFLVSAFFAIVATAFAQTSETVDQSPDVTMKGFIPDWESRRVFWNSDKTGTDSPASAAPSGTEASRRMQLEPLKTSRPETPPASASAQKETTQQEAGKPETAPKKTTRAEEKTVAASPPQSTAGTSVKVSAAPAAKKAAAKVNKAQDIRIEPKKPAEVAKAQGEPLPEKGSSGPSAGQVEISKSKSGSTAAGADEEKVVVKLRQGLTAKVSKKTAEQAVRVSAQINEEAELETAQPWQMPRRSEHVRVTTRRVIVPPSYPGYEYFDAGPGFGHPGMSMGSPMYGPGPGHGPPPMYGGHPPAFY